MDNLKNVKVGDTLLIYNSSHVSDVLETVTSITPGGQVKTHRGTRITPTGKVIGSGGHRGWNAIYARIATTDDAANVKTRHRRAELIARCHDISHHVKEMTAAEVNELLEATSNVWIRVKQLVEARRGEKR